MPGARDRPPGLAAPRAGGRGAAPLKGNQNAINQIRTNEVALNPSIPPIWELREFTLSNENPAADSDTPASGLLRPHTVAQTPNDGVYSAAGGDPLINAFVLHLPPPCGGTTVPFLFGGLPFRGGNALIPPGHWEANMVPPPPPPPAPTPPLVCARHNFSLNTCHGCHQDDSGTNGLGGSTSFTHVDPTSTIPVPLSKFLTGAGPGLMFPVPDTQFGTPIWRFADLQVRFQRLFELSHCTSCTLTPIFDPHVLDPIIAHGPVPVDPDPTVVLPFKVGPITDLAFVQQLLQLRTQFATGSRQDPVDNIRVGAVMTH